MCFSFTELQSGNIARSYVISYSATRGGGKWVKILKQFPTARGRIRAAFALQTRWAGEKHLLRASLFEYSQGGCAAVQIVQDCEWNHRAVTQLNV